MSLIKCFSTELLPVNDCTDLGFRKWIFTGKIMTWENCRNKWNNTLFCCRNRQIYSLKKQNIFFPVHRYLIPAWSLFTVWHSQIYNLDGAPAGSGPGPVEIASSWPSLIRPCIMVTTQEAGPSQALTFILRCPKHLFLACILSNRGAKFIFINIELPSF